MTAHGPSSHHRR